jgi:hypothetical protein
LSDMNAKRMLLEYEYGEDVTQIRLRTAVAEAGINLRCGEVYK